MKRPSYIAIIILLIMCNIVSWIALFNYRVQHPSDTKLYGTFGTSIYLDSALFITFEDGNFYLYQTKDGEMIDQGTWSQTNDTAVLAGEKDTYSLLLKGPRIYFCGGDFAEFVEFTRMEQTPIFISVNVSK